MTKVKMIAKSYYYNPTQQTHYTCYPAALQAALDEYNSLPSIHKKIISITNNITTKETEMNVTDAIGGDAIILYEETE